MLLKKLHILVIIFKLDFDVCYNTLKILSRWYCRPIHEHRITWKSHLLQEATLFILFGSLAALQALINQPQCLVVASIFCRRLFLLQFGLSLMSIYFLSMENLFERTSRRNKLILTW